MRTVPPCSQELVRNCAIASEQIKAIDFDEDIPRKDSRGVLVWDGLLGERQTDGFWLDTDEAKFIDNNDGIGTGGGVLGVVQTSISVERGSNLKDVDVDVFGVDDGHGLGFSDRVSSLSEMKGSFWHRECSHILGNDKDDFEPFLNPVKIEAALDVATDGDDDYMSHEGYNFSVGDFVWCKFESHPWWPGRIYDPSDASEYAASLRLKNHYLVVYFGGGTFAWCNPCQLRPFEENFQKMVKQSNSKAFINAIKEALGHIVQFLELKMASSVAREFQNKPGRSLAKNYAIKEGVLMPEVGTNNLANILFKPAKLLVRVQQLARIGRITNVLQLEMMKVHLSAFCYYKGGYGLPTYEEPTRLTANVDTTVDAPSETNGHVVELMIKGQCEEPGISKFDEPSEISKFDEASEISKFDEASKITKFEASEIGKCAGLSSGRSRTNRRRKQKSIAEILKDESENANKSVPVEQGVDIWDMPQSSINKRNSQEEANEGVDHWDMPQSSIDERNSQEEAAEGVDIWDMPQSSIDKKNSQEEETEGVDLWDMPQSSIDKRNSQEEATEGVDIWDVPQSSIDKRNSQEETTEDVDIWDMPQPSVHKRNSHDDATERVDIWDMPQSSVDKRNSLDEATEGVEIWDMPQSSVDKRNIQEKATEDVDILDVPQSSIHKRNSLEKATDYFDGGIPEYSGWKQTGISGSTSSDPTNQIADMEGTVDGKDIENGAWLGAERSEVKMEPEADAGSENKTDEPVLPTKRVGKGFRLRSKEQTQKGLLSRERKKSKYLCYPFVSPNIIEADIEGTGDKKATEDGARLGSETSEVKVEPEVDAGGEKNTEEAVLSTRDVRRFGLQSEEQNQKGSLSRERKKSKYLCYPFVSPNTIDACGVDVTDEPQQPERNAMDGDQHISSPSLSETSRPGLSIVASFCKEKDKSILQTPLQGQSNFIDRTKMKASSSYGVLSEIFSAAVNTPFEKEYTFSDLAMHFMHTFRSSSFLDGSLYAVYHEHKLGKKRNNGASSEFGSSQRDPNQNGETISIYEPQKKKRRKTNLDYQKKKSSYIAKRKGKRKKKATSPATLFLTFGPDSSSPSKADLINIYGKFGPLNETETEIFCDNFCARVSFLRRYDAEEALRYSRSTILFGSTKVNCYLQYPSAAKNTGERTRKPKHGSSLPNNPSVGETTVNHPLKLLKIRHDLVMMNSMLQASGGEVSPRTRIMLGNEIEALLEKVNTMVDSSTF